jgi:hypothetical protein
VQGPLVAEPTSEPPRITITYSVLPSPHATVTAPANGATYTLGQIVPVAYSCVDGVGAPGIESCEATPFSAFPGLETHVADDLANGAALDTSSLGVHSLTVLATSKDGLGASAMSTYTVVPQLAVADITPTMPLLSDVWQTHKRWREGNAPAHLAQSSKPPIGTTFTFVLRVSSRVHLSFSQMVHGHTVPAGVLSFAGHSGTNKIAFQGRMSRSKRLESGNYKLTITATNAAGQRSVSRPLTFVIVNSAPRD